MKLFSTVLLTVAMVPDAAIAQRTETDTGSRIGVPYRARIPDKVGLSAVDRGRLTMERFAKCMLDRSGRSVAAAFSQSSEQAQNVVLARAADSGCLSAGQIGFSHIILRGAVFAELYRRRSLGRQGLPAISGYDLERAATAEKPMRTYWWLMDLGHCVIQQDRKAGELFVIAPVTGSEETEAFKMLTPSLGPCINAEQKLTLNRSVIKAALAETLYRGPVLPSATEGKK